VADDHQRSRLATTTAPANSKRLGILLDGHILALALADAAPAPLRAEGRGDQVKDNLKQAGAKVKDAVKK
jgi:hypothetical protein